MSCTPTRSTGWSSARTAARCCWTRLTDPEVLSDELVRRMMPGWAPRVVLDALATAYVTDNHEEVAALDATVVLTVNPDELAHCLGVRGDEVSEDLEGHTSRLAARTRAVVVCGGPVKVVAHQGRGVARERRFPGLGTAGSGDVQAGIVAGLVARGAQRPCRRPCGAPWLHATRRSCRPAGGTGRIPGPRAAR